MAAWSRLHEQMRASAEFDHARIEDFEEAPLSQWLRPPAESSGPREEGSNEGGEASAAVLELWRPAWLCWDASAEAAVKIMPDRQPCLTSMSQEMQSFRERVDAAFGWHGKVLNAQRREFRAAAQVSLLLLKASPDDGKSELLQTRLFCLLAGELYRCHAGCLFEYVSGAWRPCATGLAPDRLEFVLDGLRRAQAHLSVLSKAKPKRNFEDMVWELRVVERVAFDDVLMRWQLEDIVPKKADVRASDWLQGLAELCRSLRHTFAEHHRTIVKAFLRWGDEPVDEKQQAGLCFQDCYLSTVGASLKDARRGCYMWIPAELSSAPGVETRCRYAAMLMAAFAGGNGLQVLLDQCALVVARTRQPDVMHVVVGEGHDGKTLVFVDHMRAVFGSGFGNCPCSMLQVEREFQVQGSNFVHAVWMACDEARRQQGVCEDLMKNYIGGGWLPLRKNHAQETTYGCWRYAGKVWCMNTADIPEIPTSEERSNARRFRCTYMRSRFVPQSEAVSVQDKVFAADARAKDFMSSGAAVWCFYHDFLFPHMKKFGVQACSDRLESPGAVSTTTLDTKWLLARMNRSSKAAQPEEDAAARPSAPARSEEEAATTSVAEKIVRETHKMFAGQYFGTAAAEVNRAAVAANPGVVPAKKARPDGSKKLRVDWLRDSVASFPNIIQRFERRLLDVAEWERCLATCAGEGSFVQIFGSWPQWQWHDQKEWVDPVPELRRLPDGDAWEVTCAVDLQRLRDYMSQGRDRRQVQVQDFVAMCEAQGRQSGSLHLLLTVGHQKVAAGRSLGRVFFPWLSVPNLSREARRHAAPANSVEFDIPNAVVHFAVQLAESDGLEMPCFKLYCSYKECWRRAVATWYKLQEQDSKKELLRACFGCTYARRVDGELLACPLLEGLAVESHRLQARLCEQHPDLLKCMQESGKPRPEASVLAYILFEMENQKLRQFVELLPRHKFAMVAPVFDAVVAAPDPDGDAETLVEDFEILTGIRMQVAKVCTETASTSSLQHWLSGREVPKEVLVIPGRFACIPSALANLFPETEEALAREFAGQDHPISYKEVASRVSGLCLRCLSAEEAPSLPGGARCLVHEFCPDGDEIGHAYGALVGPETVVIVTSSPSTAWEVDKQHFWQMVSGECRLRVFLAELSLDARPDKRRKTDTGGADMDVLAGARRGGEDESLAEDIIGEVRGLMRAEVEAEVMRQSLRAHLVTHLKKHHLPKTDFTTTKQQYYLACSVYEQRKVLECLRRGAGGEEGLLACSARLIHSWASIDAESEKLLAKYNFVDMALVLTRQGPQLVIKKQTDAAMRVNKSLYMHGDFADMVLAKALKHRGKIQTIFNDITSEWVSCGSLCAWMGCRRRETRQQVLDMVLAQPKVVGLQAQLMGEATRRSEWLVCSHDATFQVLFSAIGQKAMRQGDGETHAIHTVLGRSGAVAGFSLQRTEGAGCFKRAMKELLPFDARCTVRFVFSDSPDAVEGADSVLPHLEAVGEDALHFVLRVEACSGEKRTALSRRLLSIQGKFRAPATGRVYHGREDGVPHGVWPEHEEKVVEEVDWGTYMKKPFESHQEYVDAVHGLTLDFPREMDRKDAKARSIREILKAGVSYRHYRYLMNGSYIMDAVVRVVGPEAARLMSWGTCGNEALHAQLKASQQTIVQQHLEAFPLQLQAFGLAKLMAHHCAARSFACCRGSSAEFRRTATQCRS
ncbi:unnamed protein product [Effrenium voratum]|nr:unnamed protein product [Effrenium voratum]